MEGAADTIVAVNGRTSVEQYWWCGYVVGVNTLLT